jgi:predicted dehydrogenase
VDRRRVALIGTGHRGTGTWGRDLLATCGEWVDLVGLADINPLRLERAREAIGIDAPVYTDLAAMLDVLRPDTLIVASRDDMHDDHIVRALEAGVDVVSEKPMATTEVKVRRILAAEARTGRRVDVAFNYRYAPTARRVKELLTADMIGEIVSVDFHWYLDMAHGADYFRRWHAFVGRSGSLFVHKATHHFDLLNWYLASAPVEIFARGALRHYGRSGPFRSTRCKGCGHAPHCPHFLDLGADPWLDLLYEEPSRNDGYFRDACVYREEIDIFDTMSASILYGNGAQVSYSLNCRMPVEGYDLAFNGTSGRIEVRHREREPARTPTHDEILVIHEAVGAERIQVPHGGGGHFGGDPALQRALFGPPLPDPLGQRADSLAGAASVLCGLAALRSVETGGPAAVSIPQGR